MHRTSSWRTISLYSGKNGRCSQIIEKFPNRNVQTLGFVCQDTNGQNHGPVWKIQSFPLERNLYGHPWAGLERRFPIGNAYSYREKGLFLSVCVDDIKLAGKKQNMNPMWKVLNKEVDLGEPTSFLDHVYLGCTQRQCEISKDIVDNYRTMFESRISAGATEKLPCSENLRISSWSDDMEGHAKKCVERFCGWRTKRLNNSTKYQLHALMTIISKKKNWNPWENCQKYALRLSWNAFSWHVLDDPIFFGQWIKTCTIDHKMDQGLWQTIISFDLLYLSYMWIQTVLSCGKHCQTMQAGTISRLRFCRSSWGFKIFNWWNIVHFWKSYICSNKLDV